MDRVKCDIRAAAPDDRGELTLLAEETLRPLATGAGHPERYHAAELLDLLDRADVYVARVGAETAGFMAVEDQADDLAVRCLCVHPAYEARGVANQLLDWAEGVAVDRRRRRLTAFVPASDQPSLHLYRGHEFSATRAEDDAEMVVLEKKLPQPAE
jgi:ribosomal protein S18 acetylase RimI-like enzyme